MYVFNKKRPFCYDKNRQYWAYNKREHIYENIDETGINISFNEFETSDEKSIFSSSSDLMLRTIQVVGRENMPIPPPKTHILFRNSIIDINTLKHIRPSRKWFHVNNMPYMAKLGKQTPNITRIMKEWVDSDENVYTLKEIIAYCMYRGYPIHKAFAFVGSGSNGKSSFLRLVHKMLGQNNVISDSFENLLGNRFATTELHKKLALLIGEINQMTMQNSQLFKSLTGGDLIRFEPKFKGAFHDYSYAKVLIASNYLPITNDRSVGYFRRWHIIEFKNRFGTNTKDPLDSITELEFQEFSGELLQILNDLIGRGDFKYAQSEEMTRRLYEQYSNPIQRFFDEHVKLVDEDVAKEYGLSIDQYNKSVVYPKYYMHTFRGHFGKWAKQHDLPSVTYYMMQKFFDAMGLNLMPDGYNQKYFDGYSYVPDLVEWKKRLDDDNVSSLVKHEVIE